MLSSSDSDNIDFRLLTGDGVLIFGVLLGVLLGVDFGVLTGLVSNYFYSLSSRESPVA